jgi:hypothetical protein
VEVPHDPLLVMVEVGDRCLEDQKEGLKAVVLWVLVEGPLVGDLEGPGSSWGACPSYPRVHFHLPEP